MLATLSKLSFIAGVVFWASASVAEGSHPPISCGADTAAASVTAATLKDFAPLAEAYAFFEDHSTENAHVLAAHKRLIEDKFGDLARALDVLDFGCSTGRFISALFQNAMPLTGGLSHITLVDRDAAALVQASTLMWQLAAPPTRGLADFSTSTSGDFDLIVAKHVVHHIPDPLEAVLLLASKLRPKDSAFLLTLATDRNGLNQMAYAGYRLLNRPLPQIAKVDEFKAPLLARGFKTRVKRVESKLRFSDSLENRRHIARFVFGADYTPETSTILRSLFTQYLVKGEIIIPLDDAILIVEPK